MSAFMYEISFIMFYLSNCIYLCMSWLFVFTCLFVSIYSTYLSILFVLSYNSWCVYVCLHQYLYTWKKTDVPSCLLDLVIDLALALHGSSGGWLPETPDMENGELLLQKKDGMVLILYYKTTPEIGFMKLGMPLDVKWPQMVCNQEAIIAGCITFLIIYVF